MDSSALWGLGRGGRTRESPEPKRLSVIFAETVTGKHLRDIKLMLVGAQGAGKSRSLLYLACECAKEIAARVGGSPEDYFPSDLSNVVIGDPQGHAELFQNMRKYSIIILDDAGVSVNARNFMTTYNKSMNDVFQTMRPNRSIVLISTPDTMTTDVIIRSLVSHYGEVSESYHGHGYNLVKIFNVVRKFREGRTNYVYPKSGNKQIVRYKFLNPPEEIIQRYEKKRLEATRQIAARAGKEKEKKHNKEATQTTTCRHCGYVYTAKSENPRRCPNCFKSLQPQQRQAKPLIN